MGVLDSDRASGVVTHNVPLLDAALDTQGFDRRGKSIELAETPGQARRAAETGQIDGDAGEVAAYALDHSVLEIAARGHAMQKEHRVS